jgi:glucan phosphoethanolaminetransferase (alkaline phosphatase superfamily)
VNISATHPPTHGYVPGARADTVDTQAAALEYVDRQLPSLFGSLRERGRGGMAYLLSDHGTLFGEDSFTGHRIGHPAVWTVPYGEYAWEPQP